MNPLDQSIAYWEANNAYDKQPKGPYAITLRELYSKNFQHPIEGIEDKRLVPLFLWVKYKDGAEAGRKGDVVAGRTLFAIDFDNEPETWSREQIVERLSTMGFAFIGHTSWKRSETNFRLRVYIPIKEAVWSADQYQMAHAHFLSIFGAGPMDPKVSDVSRGFFKPCTRPDRHSLYETVIQEGRALSIDDIPRGKSLKQGKDYSIDGVIAKGSAHNTFIEHGGLLMSYDLPEAAIRGYLRGLMELSEYQMTPAEFESICKQVKNLDPGDDFFSKYRVVVIGNNIKVMEICRPGDIRFYDKGSFYDKEARVMKAATRWFVNAHRYMEVVFEPDESRVDNARQVNMWTGTTLDPMEVSDTDVKPFLDHARDVICGGKDSELTYLLAWCANYVQTPWNRPGVVVVLKGGQGCGKNTFADMLGRIYKEHYLVMGQSHSLTSNFNDELRCKLLVMADEAFWAGDKSKEGALKTLVTGNTLRIEQKGVNAFYINNYIHLLMATNNDWAVPAAHDARRFFVPSVSDHRIDDRQYWDSLYRWIDEEEGIRKIYSWLLKYKHDVDLRFAPNTLGLLMQKELSSDSVEMFIEEVLDRGVLHKSGIDGPDWDDINVTLLYEEYLDYCQRRDIKWFEKMPQHFTKKLNKIGLLREAEGGGFTKVKKIQGRSVRVLLFKSHDVCVKAMENWRNNVRDSGEPGGVTIH